MIFGHKFKLIIIGAEDDVSLNYTFLNIYFENFVSSGAQFHSFKKE